MTDADECSCSECRHTPSAQRLQAQRPRGLLTPLCSRCFSAPCSFPRCLPSLPLEPDTSTTGGRREGGDIHPDASL